MKRLLFIISIFAFCFTTKGQQVYQMQNRLREDDAIERKQVQANGFSLDGMNNVWSLEDILISSKTFKTEYTIAGDTLTGLERGNRIYYRQANGHLSYKIDSAKYICAYNYIKDNTTAKRIRISRCVVDLDRWAFPIDSLADYPEEKNALIAFVERKKNERNKESFSDEITIKIPVVKRPRNILFFSQPKIRNYHPIHD